MSRVRQGQIHEYVTCLVEIFPRVLLLQKEPLVYGKQLSILLSRPACTYRFCLQVSFSGHFSRCYFVVLSVDRLCGCRATCCNAAVCAHCPEMSKNASTLFVSWHVTRSNNVLHKFLVESQYRHKLPITSYVRWSRGKHQQVLSCSIIVAGGHPHPLLEGFSCGRTSPSPYTL